MTTHNPLAAIARRAAVTAGTVALPLRDIRPNQIRDDLEMLAHVVAQVFDALGEDALPTPAEQPAEPLDSDDALNVVREHLEAMVPNAPAGSRLHVLANLAHARMAALERTLHVSAILAQRSVVTHVEGQPQPHHEET